MTEAIWWDQHTVLMNEIHLTSDSFYTWKRVNEIAASNPDVFRQVLKHPAFWNIVLHGLQTTFVITIGRIFDTNAKSNSIDNLLTEMVAHPEYFSKPALELRKRDQVKGDNLSWLPGFMNEAWAPSKLELEQLRDGMKPTIDKYRLIYKPIRDKIFAHRDIGVDVHALLGKTLISEVEEILYAVRDNLECLSNIYQNGLKPRLGKRIYDNAPLSTETSLLMFGLKAGEE